MALPQPFTTTSQQLVNYDWTDIAEGTGIVTFDAMTTQEGATISRILKTTPLKSKTIVSSSTSGVTPVTDFDFDLSVFNSARRIGGSCYVYLPTTYVFSYGGGEVGTCTFTATIRKWDGTTETDIGTASGVAFGGTVGTYYQINIFKIELTETNFAKGDILRLNISNTETHGGSPTASSANVYHDPEDAAVAGLDFTYLKVEIPFKLDL